MKEVKMNFLKKSNEEEMYSKIVKMLLKKGYKPLNNTIYRYTFDCKRTKTSNYPFSEINNLKPYPYTITINYKPAA